MYFLACGLRGPRRQLQGSQSEALGRTIAPAPRGRPEPTEPPQRRFAQRRKFAWPRHHHSFGGSPSARATPMFASKYAFCSIFQDLQENHLLANFCEVSTTFATFYIFKENFRIFAILDLRILLLQQNFANSCRC